MTIRQKELIEKRAIQMARICEHVLLNENESDEVAATGFKWCYLILRRPRKFLENFHNGDLRINFTLLKEAFWLYSENLDGPNTLLPEEIKILEDHDFEATKFMESSSNVISLVRTSPGSFS